MQINKIFFLFIIVTAIIPFLITDAYAETAIEKGKYYDLELLSVDSNGTKTYKLATHYERIFNGSQYVDYVLTNDNDQIKVETELGSVILHKNYCSFSFYNGGFISEKQASIFSDSIVAKRAVVNTTNWQNVNQINNAACQASFSESNDTLTLSAKKQNSIGYMIYKYIFKDGEWKTELEIKNNSIINNNKFGFTQTIDLNRDIIKFGNSTIDLQTKNGTVYDRAWIIAHKGKIVDLLNGQKYDFDLAFDYLKKVTVYAYSDNTSKLVFDFLNTNDILEIGETLILDPTYTQNTANDFLNIYNGQPRVSIGQKFTTGHTIVDGTVSEMSVWLRKQGSPTGTATAYIKNAANGVIATMGTLDVSTLTGTAAKKTFNSASGQILNGYKITIEYSGGDGSNYMQVNYQNSNVEANGQIQELVGGSWSDLTGDLRFEVIYTVAGDPPDRVDDLVAFVRSATQIDLEWSFPDNGTGTFQAFKINYTAPYGNPLTHRANTTNTYYNVTNLTFGTGYSFRVASCTEFGCNATGNIANATTISTTYSTPPQNLRVYANVSDNTRLNLQWSSGIMQNINGYRIERETPIGSGFSQIVSNTTNTNIYYNNTGLTTCIIYNYRVYAMNGSGISTASNEDDMTTFRLPDEVDDLTAEGTSLSSIDLSWTTPIHCSLAILGYQINYTTPYGNPLTPITNNTGSTATAYEVTRLTVGAETSFRVSAVTVHGRNATGNIANATTFSNFTIGSLGLDTTPIGDLGIYFEESEYNSTTTNVNVIYPNTVIDLRCDIAYQNLNSNRTYTGLSSSTFDTTHDNTTLRFVGVANEIIAIYCWDSTEPDVFGQHIITQTTFPFLDNIELFREGGFGISSSFGALDIITLIVIIVSMIGFNKENPAAGIIIATMILGMASFFEIIIIETTLFGALALVVAVAIAVTRKQ